MKITQAVTVLLLAIFIPFYTACGQQLARTEGTDELATARQMGWVAAFSVIEQLNENKQQSLPGIEEWLADFANRTTGLDPQHSPAEWPKVDIDVLAKRNPKFWRAVYEISPGDPGVVMLYAGILLGGGESIHAMNVLELQFSRPGIPKEIHNALGRLHTAATSAFKPADPLIKEGIALHDKGDYAGAIAKYREALAIWPQSPLAHYELAYTLRIQQLLAAGERPGDPGAESRVKMSPEILALMAQTRRYSPFLESGYGTSEPEIARAREALLRKIQPAVKYMGQRLDATDSLPEIDRALEVFAEGCQEAGVHDIALIVRQIMVARRGKFEPADHPFIADSLRKLAPGPNTEAVLERLALPSNAFLRVVPITDQDPGQEPEWMFKLGTPHFIKEKNSIDTFTIVLPVKAQKPEQFNQPGLRPAIAAFDPRLKVPISDLKMDEKGSTVKFNENGTPEIMMSMSSRQQGVTLKVQLMAPPQYKSTGQNGAIRIGFRGFPDKDMAFFLCDGESQASRILVLRKENFIEGDSEATFQTMIAKLPVDLPEKKR